MINDVVVTGLGLASKLPEMVRSAKAGSLVEYTQATRVEPIVLIDEKVTGLSYAPDIMQSLTSLFSGYYLQAVALSVNVGKVDVIKLLDRLNPKRSVTDNVTNAISNGVAMVASLEHLEAYRWSLPIPGQAMGLESFGGDAVITYSPEAKGDDDDKNKLNDKPAGPAIEFGKDQIKLLGEATNLSVGKMLEVHVESEGQKAVFAINVRLICTAIGSKELVHTLSVGSKVNSVKERWHAWRAGQLEFMRDLVMCQDLIDAHKKTLLKDSSGVYSEILSRRNGNSLSAIFSGNPSVATASNLIVLSSSTAKELEREIGGRLKDFRTREKVFKNTYGMILVVVDPEWDHVTFYHRSIDIPTEMTAKELASSNKGKGPDVSEILKAYQMGGSPSI